MAGQFRIQRPLQHRLRQALQQSVLTDQIFGLSVPLQQLVDQFRANLFHFRSPLDYCGERLHKKAYTLADLRRRHLHRVLLHPRRIPLVLLRWLKKTRLVPYRTPPAGRTSLGNSTPASYSPRSNRAAQTGRITGWWHHRSSRSGTTSLRAPPASRARWYPTVPVPQTGSAWAAKRAPASPSLPSPATASPPSSTAAPFLCSLRSRASGASTPPPGSARTLYI